MDKVIPNQLNFNTIKPVGYPSQTKYEKFTPTSFTSATANDIIRFNINTNGFWDPYSAYIKIEVDLSGDTDGIGMKVLDTSAHSLIQQLIIYNNGIELERLEEYDVLANLLIDVNHTPENRSTKLNEGVNSIINVARSRCNAVSYVENPDLPADNTYRAQIGYNPLFSNGVGLEGVAIKSQSLNYKNNPNNEFATIQRYEIQYSQYSDSTVQSSTTYSKNPTSNNTLYREIPGSLTNYTINPRQAGFNQPFNYSLSSQEDFVFGNYNNFQETYKGKLSDVIQKQKATFTIPLMSGLLGFLMPKDSYKYIPMKALQQLILEFKMNPYAFFTSGYTDDGVQLSMTDYKQQSRNYKITKFEINVEMQYFEPQVENIILNQLSSDKGIILHTNSWQLGPKFALAANQGPNGTYQVNLGFESLRNLLFFVIPDDYIYYSFCRKLFRISANILQYYFKIGTNYIPSLPISGHAGTPIFYKAADTDANNSEFIIQLYKVFGKYQNTLCDSFIDSNNFAVNQRAYNPTSVQNFLSGANYDTTLGQPLFHEQRCVGKALYAMNFQSLNNDQSVISGINTIQNRPFELNIKSDTANIFTRNSTMYTYCQYDMLIQLKSSGVQVIGRG